MKKRLYCGLLTKESNSTNNRVCSSLTLGCVFIPHLKCYATGGVIQGTILIRSPTLTRHNYNVRYYHNLSQISWRISITCQQLARMINSIQCFLNKKPLTYHKNLYFFFESVKDIYFIFSIYLLIYIQNCWFIYDLDIVIKFTRF